MKVKHEGEWYPLSLLFGIFLENQDPCEIVWAICKCLHLRQFKMLTSHGLIAKEEIIEELEAGGWWMDFASTQLMTDVGPHVVYVDGRILLLPWCNRSSLGWPARYNRQSGMMGLSDCLLASQVKTWLFREAAVGIAVGFLMMVVGYLVWTPRDGRWEQEMWWCDDVMMWGRFWGVKYRSFSSHLIYLWSWAAWRKELRLWDTTFIDFHWFSYYKLSWEYHVCIIETWGAQKILL